MAKNVTAKMTIQEEAEQFAEGLGMITGGLHMQVMFADGKGYPAALGMTLPEYVNEKLGGYVRIPINDRRDVAKELSEKGLSNRKIASILGVSHVTVLNDLRGNNLPTDDDPDDSGEGLSDGSGNNLPLEQSSITENVDPETGEIIDAEAGSADATIDVAGRVVHEPIPDQEVKDDDIPDEEFVVHSDPTKLKPGLDWDNLTDKQEESAKAFGHALIDTIGPTRIAGKLASSAARLLTSKRELKVFPIETLVKYGSPGAEETLETIAREAKVISDTASELLSEYRGQNKIRSIQ